ncbi:MAG: hypothetical protein GY714_19035 [Desulfobacterales bacterium]|nr:hypothetical protein [Desulfobacterales bacterium]MCP4161363.1 hypothetical protein [Deltaproteobacteria bacterium]
MAVSFDSVNKTWVVDLNNNKRHLKTFIEPEGVNSCLIDGECIGLGLDIPVEI